MHPVRLTGFAAGGSASVRAEAFAPLTSTARYCWSCRSRNLSVRRWRNDLDAAPGLMQLVLPSFVLAVVSLLLWSALASWRGQVPAAVTQRERIARGLGVVLSVVPVLWLLFVPTYGVRTETMASGGSSRSSTTSAATLLEVEGPSALIPLLLPLALLAVPVVGWRAAKRRTITRLAAILLTVFVVLGSFTVGLFFVPAALALWMAIPPATSTERPA